MATKDITTWDEFKTALTETVTEVTTYELKNDINVTDNVITSGIKFQSVYGSNFLKKINGNKHKINGITIYGNITLFNLVYNQSAVVEFNDISFSNFMMSGGNFINTSCFSGINNVVFNRCFFNGICNNFTTNTTNTSQYTNRTTQFKNCSFNVKCNTFAYTSNFSNCWIHIEPLVATNNLILQVSNANYYLGDNNYVEGVIKNTVTTTYNLVGYQSGTNNVFNINFIATNTTQDIQLKICTGAPSVTNVCLYNKDKLQDSTGSTYTNVSTLNNVVGLTDSQLKSKNYIQNNTTFPLYG